MVSSAEGSDRGRAPAATSLVTLSAATLLGLVTLAIGAPTVRAAAPGHGVHRSHQRPHRHRRAHRAPPAAGGVVVRRTAFGVPHVQASSFEGAGYGYGFAFAQDNLCTAAEDFVTVNGQRSRYFGPNASYFVLGKEMTESNLNSDFFWQQVSDTHTIQRLVAEPPPQGPRPEALDLARGYAAGYDRFLASVGGSTGVPDTRCRGKAWVRPIAAMDVWRRIYELEEFASGVALINGIGEAQPPGAGALPSSGLGIAGLRAPALPRGLGADALPGADASTPIPNGFADALRRRLHGALGSNAVAIGRAGTRDHTHGLLLGNPHFPWTGPQRFYQAQLTIPGRMNVEGVSLLGTPLILIGHTDNMAWSHTVSTAFRFAPYQLSLVPGDPTSYYVDGKPEAMTRRSLTVQALQGDGSVRPITRTLYSSRYGPMFDNLAGSLALPWTTSTAYTEVDANADVLGRVANTFLSFDQAQSAPEMLDILKRYEGIPFVNTVVADRQGNALYADIGSVPHVTNNEISQCNTQLGTVTFKQAGLAILDGSRSGCRPGSDPDAIKPGIFGPQNLPHLTRSDYVTNSNDSYWLANPHQPLTGYARMIGSEGSARSLRTRIGLIETQARVDGSDGQGPAGFTRQDMQNLDFGDQVYSAELTRDALVGMCRGLPGGLAPTSSGAPVTVRSACEVLAHWDRRDDLGSRGAVLFQRFWLHANKATPSPFAHPFDPADPVRTPNTLDTSNPTVRLALGDAIADLDHAHVALDASVGDVQYVAHDGLRIPIPGGAGDPLGVFNAIYTDGAGETLAPAPFLGSSYVQVVTWNASPCPDAATILTYSESDNPASAHFADQTARFSAKGWVPESFCHRDVLAHTLSTDVLRAASASPSRNARVRKRHRRARRR